MKNESNIKPHMLEIERHGECAEVIFREDITEETREIDGGSEAVYTYDEYRLTVPNRETLLQTVKEAKAKWLERAKRAEYDALASAVREKRDKLLAETDAWMCFDRMGLSVPTETTFAAWLSFLSGLGNVLSGEWAKYRQALRDIPQQEGFPYHVEFPTMPEYEKQE